MFDSIDVGKLAKSGYKLDGNAEERHIALGRAVSEIGSRAVMEELGEISRRQAEENRLALAHNADHDGHFVRHHYSLAKSAQPQPEGR
jgi:hypothetical protein